jgi:hypothetical protein
MSRTGQSSVGLPVRWGQSISAAAGKHETGAGLPLPLYGALIFAGIRILSLATAAFLLPRMKVHGLHHSHVLHYSLPHFIRTWDGGFYLTIAVHGYSYVPGTYALTAYSPGSPVIRRPFMPLPGYPESAPYGQASA